MTLYLGIDESILRINKREKAFIYVGTFTRIDAQGKISETKLKKIRDWDERKPLDLAGLEGFLFGSFIFNNQIQNMSSAQLASVYTLINEGLYGANQLGILEPYDKVKIEIDGHDVYRIGHDLQMLTSSLQYSEGIDVEFVSHGDEAVKIINRADFIAYFLRELKQINEGKGIDTNLSEMGRRALERDIEKNLKIKKLAPFHLSNRPKSLERRVA